MEDKYILKKDHLKSFLRKLTKEYRLVAPVLNPHGDTMFTPIEAIDDQDIDLVNQPQNSIKPFFFPQNETICTYSAKSPGDYRIREAELQTEPSIFFGIRPCDLNAILYMDVIFQRDAKDPFYLRRRKTSLLIGLNCNKPFPNCFCNATKSGPYMEYGSDLQFTDLGDRYLVEVGRALGRKILDRWQQFFTEASSADSDARYQAFLESRGAFSRQIHVDQAIKRIKDNAVNDDVWSFLSQRCQDCGGCTFVCPTCTCFNITDQPTSDTEGLRIRSWDACTFSGFTRMAGDHNPVLRSTGAIKQRFMHKLHYDVIDHGRPSCVGCGRCVGICFGGTDIVRFINLSCQENSL